jgi:hypothetical protein
MGRSIRAALAAATCSLLLATCFAAQAAAEPAPRAGFAVISAAGAVGASPEATPNCGKGVGPRKVVARYKAKRVGTAGYRTVTLYCGDAGAHGYGYRHLEPHVGQYFGGWGSFNFSIAQVLKVPAHVVTQSNGNYRESGPIYQCFYAGYHYIWTFYVVRTIVSGSIITAYGSRGKKINQPCP